MTHRLVVAYREGRKAFPHTFANPYAGLGDRVAARMWRLGWQRAAEDMHNIPSEQERIDRIAAEIDALLD
ncbi:ribosome modulation factor [Mycolicibacterium phlei]